ncbi:hypothetical protein B9Z19DRAFT_1069933 [Tuber borchii]|uniref:Uncharacterized protein n=1 Tax=Tuber borchii TaxID=42251 RepID=A0A2T6Z9P7_TUBBO|nr:hypothetical protein B9Z19DRAFT_1069933 [Tuber borchii]
MHPACMTVHASYMQCHRAGISGLIASAVEFDCLIKTSFRTRRDTGIVHRSTHTSLGNTRSPTHATIPSHHQEITTVIRVRAHPTTSSVRTTSSKDRHTTRKEVCISCAAQPGRIQHIRLCFPPKSRTEESPSHRDEESIPSTAFIAFELVYALHLSTTLLPFIPTRTRSVLHTLLASLARCLTLSPKAFLSPYLFLLTPHTRMSSSRQPTGRNSLKNLYLRAASPTMIASAQAAVRGSDVPDVKAYTTHAISMAKDFNDLITSMPTRYRHLLGDPLRSMQATNLKYCNALQAFNQLQQHQANETWPSYLASMKNPFDSIQVTKEASSSLAASITKANTWFREQRVQALQTATALKKEEAEILCKTCSPQTVTSQLLDLVKADWVALKRAHGRYVLPATVDAEGNQLEQKTGTDIPGFLKVDYELALEMTPIWVSRTWSFSQDKALRRNRI